MPQINRKTIVPDRYEIKKTGTGKGGPWTLYVVTDQDGIQYKSWGKKYKWEDLLGQEVAIEFEEKVSGQFRDNIIIEDSFRSRSRVSLDEVVARIDRLEVLIRQIHLETFRRETGIETRPPTPNSGGYGPDADGYGPTHGMESESAGDDIRHNPTSASLGRSDTERPRIFQRDLSQQSQQPPVEARYSTTSQPVAAARRVDAARRATAGRPRVLDEEIPVIEQDIDF